MSLEEKLTVGCSIKTYLGIVLSFTLLTSDLARTNSRKLIVYFLGGDLAEGRMESNLSLGVN